MDPRTILEQLRKGAISPTDLSVGGTLEPENAQRFISLIVDQSQLLKRITVKRTGKITGNFKNLDIADQVLVRVAEGSEPSAGQLVEPSRTDVNFLNLPMQLFYQLLFQTIDDNQANPNFESDMEQMFALKFANELVLLGMLGVNDDYAGGAWTRLNKGWLQVAKENVPVGQRVNTNGATTVKQVLDAMLTAMPPKWKRQGVTTFMLNVSDWELFMDEIGSAASAVLGQILLDGKLPTYKGYPLFPVEQMPTLEPLFTDPLNLALTMHTEIKRFREVRGSKRCIDYTFDLAPDYLIQNKAACVVAWDQGY